MLRLALHIGGEAIDRVVADGDSLLLAVIGQHGQHRPEDFLARDGHVVGDIGKDGGLHIIALVQPLRPPRPAGNQRGAFLDALLDQALDLVPLGFADHRAHGAVAIGVPHGGGFGDLLGDGGSFGHAPPRHQHAGRRVAALAAVHHHALHAAGHGLHQIGIGQHDVGGLAAQFLRHALHRVGRVLGHRDAGAGGAGEAHHVDILVARQRHADARAITVDKVEHALGHPGRVQDLGPDIGREGGDFRRLEHHGAAHGQRRRHLAGDLVDRPVPRRDEGAHADRLLGDQRGAAQFVELVALQHLDGGADMADAKRCLRLVRQPGRRAHFLGDGRGNVVVALLIFAGDGAQQLDALLDAGAAERGEGGLGGGDGAIDIGGAAQVDAARHLLGGRVDHVERVRRGRIHPGPVDVEFRVVTHGASSPKSSSA